MATDLDQDDYLGFYHRGCANDHLGKYKEAIDDYSRAIERNPYDADALYYRGIDNSN
ncbi:MAG: tetratricopeptide repeat protein [Candidatus Omnitrophica bacterium]|nr:tetratricopeptide repeat protein [Candidatus Omnitrophota bacterium]